MVAAKVGVVVVSYNAATAVRVTLASLRAACTNTPFRLVLVDNASRADEREAIGAALSHHAATNGTTWRMLQQDRNLGFSGGNNVGIRSLLADPAITHVCLLNSDVIVPHGWLDQLLASGKDIVSPVTNKAESEQCVPIDYHLELADCLQPGGETLRAGVFETVDAFASRRRRAFAGNVVDCDATFFCVLIARPVMERIGLLDERFFPGGYEDDDYCARARALGVPVHLDRSVYLHHWGSASFGQLDPGYFSENARRNRAWLEQKHGFTWRIRPEKPFVAYFQDFDLARSDDEARRERQGLHDAYGKALGKLLSHYRSEFTNLRRATRATAKQLPAALARELAAAEAHTDLEARWRRLHAAIGSRLRESGDAAGPAAGPLPEVGQFVEAVHDVAKANFSMHAFLVASTPAGAATPRGARPWPWRLLSLIRHGLPFLARLRGIVFLGGYPYPARDGDGYYQRIRAIDRMFEDRWRIYYDPCPLPGQTAWYDMPAPRTLVLRPGGGRWPDRLALLTLWVCALRCRAVYFHSVLRMQDMGFARLLRVPFVRKVLDVHGVVPEEFRMHDDFRSATLFDRHEELAVRKVDGLIVVTEAMRAYFAQKYPGRGRGEVVVLPIFPAIAHHRDSKPYVDGRPVVVYAGGLHKWQQVPKMVDAIVRTHAACLHRFYCTDPDAVRAMLPPDVLASGHVLVDRKSHEDLLLCYRECHYGFLLRADSIVNRVACPTKVVEYLAMGIVPIVDSEQVGDFRGLGIRWVALADFLAGRLPDEATRDAMARDNFVVHGRLSGQRAAGAAQLRRLFGPGPRPGSLVSRLLWQVGKRLPPNTRRGRLARRLWHAVRGKPSAPAAADAGAMSHPDLAPCDVMVQVGHFLAGGLENAVLDLNEAFLAAGLRVSLLVLGEQGAAVARARAQGVPVCADRYSDDAYRHWLRTAKPKLVMSHYSVDGATLCREAGVPLVQVIHNIYLWVRDAELKAMRASAEATTMFVACSRFAKEYSVSRLDVPADRCVVIPYGIDVRRFRELDGERQRLRRLHGIGDDDFVFLNVGAINHQKNLPSQLRAFRAIASRCPSARLVSIGPVYEQELLLECKRAVERDGLADRVTFAGGVSDPHGYYAMADALVHSAFFEGGPLALLEALAANLPVVTVATGLAIHFTGKKGVFTVPPHFDVTAYEGEIGDMPSSPTTETALAAAMERVYRERMRPDLPADVVDGFDRRNAYRRYVELVLRLTSRNSDQPPAAVPTWAERLDASD